jgi:hypothetical protein
VLKPRLFRSEDQSRRYLFMAERHCPSCGTDVEDAGGFCFLVHPLRLQSMTEAETLDDLRAEVNRAFEDVKVQVEEALGEIDINVPPPPPGPRSRVVPATDARELDQPGTPIRTYDDLWKAFEDEAARGEDPITAFAPPPRMDWGPERSKLRRRGMNGAYPEPA